VDPALLDKLESMIQKKRAEAKGEGRS
jgi:hypothetical protein